MDSKPAVYKVVRPEEPCGLATLVAEICAGKKLVQMVTDESDVLNYVRACNLIETQRTSFEQQHTHVYSVVRDGSQGFHLMRVTMWTRRIRCVLSTIKLTLQTRHYSYDHLPLDTYEVFGARSCLLVPARNAI